MQTLNTKQLSLYYFKAWDGDNPGGFGAMLTQLWADGMEHMVTYATHALKPNEKKYSAYLLESILILILILLLHLCLCSMYVCMYV